VTAVAAAQGYREALADASEAALDAAGARDHDLVVGGRAVRLRFAGPVLEAAMLPPFGHLPAFAGEPERTIVVWDTASTGVAPPPFAWTSADVGARGELGGLRDGAVRAAVDHTSGAITLWDADRATAFVWIASVARLPWWERVVPLRVALLEALSGPGRELVHAAAVGGALLGGAGGSGKSTTAVACALAGLPLAGDDHVCLDVSGPRPVAHGLHRTAKLEADALARLPAARDVLWPVPSPPGAKAVLLLDAVARVDLTCVLLPRVADATATSVRPVSAATALRALAPSTIFQVPRDGGRQLRVLSAAVRALPCFELVLGRDGRAAAVVREVAA
jgi:hypothetical protein